VREKKMDFFELVKTRRSIRKYKKGAQITRETLLKIAETGAFAPSGRAVNPWKFVILTDRARIDGLQKIIGNNGRFLLDASAAIIVLCEDTKYFIEDGSAAAENILLAAHAAGLGACWIAGDKKDYAHDVEKYLEVPAGYKLICTVSIGVPDETPRVQKPGPDVVIRWDRFSL
jgi:nitroreductase